MGSGVALELIRMTHGREQCWGWGCKTEGAGDAGWGGQRGENQDNYNSIINFLKKEIKKKELHIIPRPLFDEIISEELFKEEMKLLSLITLNLANPNFFILKGK